jgi:hypothetical protein
MPCETTVFINYDPVPGPLVPQTDHAFEAVVRGQLGVRAAGGRGAARRPDAPASTAVGRRACRSRSASALTTKVYLVTNSTYFLSCSSPRRLRAAFGRRGFHQDRILVTEDGSAADLVMAFVIKTFGGMPPHHVIMKVPVEVVVITTTSTGTFMIRRGFRRILGRDIPHQASRYPCSTGSRDLRVEVPSAGGGVADVPCVAAPGTGTERS